MRVVTWNMGCGPRSRYRECHDEAWTYLLEELRPDVALVQEALVTQIDGARWCVARCDLGAGVDAGTAVLARGLELTPAVAIAVSAQTCVAAATVATPAGPLTVAAVHVYPGKEQHADLARLIELARTSFGDQPVLIGGDFNSARHFDKVHGGKRHGAFFAGMEAAGFHDVHWAIHGREIQSFWGHQAKEAYQDDHFFIAKPWASRVVACSVIDNEIVRRVSDHGPLLLELNVEAA